MATGFGAGLVQAFKRRARQFELPGRFETDRAIDTAQSDHIAALFHRLPTETLQIHEYIADTAGLFIRGGAKSLAAKHELFMLSADAPALLGLFARGHGGGPLIPMFDIGLIGSA